MANPKILPRDDEPRKKITVPTLRPEKINILWGLLASVVSLIAHVILIILVMFINVDTAKAEAGDVGETVVEEDPGEKQLDLTNTEVGIDSSVQTNYNLDRIEDISVPGMVNPMEAVGLQNAPENIAKTLPLPAGVGGGTGAAAISPLEGGGAMFGTLGGMGGVYVPGGFGGRSGATREKMALEGGGNAASEACVARGLEWLALHQANDGSWSLVDFNKTTRQKPLGQPGSVISVTGGDRENARENKIAATAFALLPFLAAGQTHKYNKDNKIDYSKTVMGGLDWLIRQQGKDGSFGGGMYAHGVATIVMGEAFGMTGDPRLKTSALGAMKYLQFAQHDGGGWRYEPKQPGDLSVVGWQVMGLKSCEMAGLPVPKELMSKVDRFLDASYDEKGYRFKYTPESGGGTPTMTAVGMLCRLYRGINPRNPAIIKGVEVLKARTPVMGMQEFYYAYYATQVMHHIGGEAWDFWNLGPSGDGKTGMRDLLVKSQDLGGKKVFQNGSWAPTGSFHDGGSRVISTSMALLMLEVYYRHLPLYRRDLGVTKEMAK